ncbi:MAG: BrxA/BrxB family bacilliredoxin [Schleiferiaceae bacterium]
MFITFATKYLDMYPEDLIAPMRQDLVEAGFVETRTSAEVEKYINNTPGTTLVVINSVCGCAAGSARPAAKKAVTGTSHKPDNLITAFAGNDVDGVNTARALMAPFPPSSPSMALFKDGKLVHMIERHHIEGRTADMIADNLEQAFEEHC